MNVKTELIRKWHVLRFNYYMHMFDGCLCPEYRKQLMKKAEWHIRQFEATFESWSPAEKGSVQDDSSSFWIY